MKAILRRLRSLTARMMLNHILVAALTSVIVSLLLLLILIMTIQNIKATDYRSVAMLHVASWQLGVPDGQPNLEGLPEGFSLIVGSDNVVLHSYGDTGCRAGMPLAECNPALLNRTAGERFFDRNGQRWAEVVAPTLSGARVIAQYGPPKPELQLTFPGLDIKGNLAVVLFISATMAILSLPVALILAWLWARPLGRRLRSVAKASQQFAGGDFAVRVNDRRQDEIGDLARQFDDMAATLEHNVGVLRELASRNAELAVRAEEAAIQAERVRLSRDLHDDIAQQLFSLSLSTASLPDLIERSQPQGAQQARAIAGLAEQTLVDLRALLIELRPSAILQRGLAEALQGLCDEWEKIHHVEVTCSVMLTGRRLPAGVEDVLYRVAQESLSNIAKHAQARSVQVSVVEGRQQITLSTTDDGKGFDLAAVTSPGKFGLTGMRERASSVGGKLAVESDTRQGTTLRLTLPLERDDLS